MADNVHASAVVIGDRGILVSGASGQGKTGLVLALLAQAHVAGSFGRLVGDDQLLLTVHGGRLFCTVPEALAGLIEIRGLGPRAIGHVRKAPVDLVVDLVDRIDAPRFPETGTRLFAGCRIPLLTLPGDDREAAVRAIAARLALPPFG